MKTDWKKNARVLITSQSVSLLGSSLVQYAIMWHITWETKSGVATMIAVVCGFLPTLLLSPFAGVWADRYDRKKLIMFADGGIAFSTLVLAVIFMQGYTELWLLYVVLVIRAVGGAVQMPAVNALIPSMVPQEHLTKVNGINSSVQSLITLVSPMLSGVLIGFVALENIFLIDVVTAAIAIAVMAVFLKLPKKENAENAENAEKSGYLKAIKSGFSYINKNKSIKQFLIFVAVVQFLVSPVAMLTPLQVARTFGGAKWHLPAIQVALSLGMIVGGLVIASWGGFKNRVITISAATCILGVCTAALGVPTYFWLYLVFMVLCGIALPAFNTSAMVLLQEKVEPEYMGRIFGVMAMLTGAITPLGMMIYGPLADVIAIEKMLIVTGIGMGVVGVIMGVNKALLKAGEPLPKTEDDPQKTI